MDAQLRQTVRLDYLHVLYPAPKQHRIPQRGDLRTCNKWWIPPSHTTASGFHAGIYVISHKRCGTIGESKNWRLIKGRRPPLPLTKSAHWKICDVQEIELEASWERSLFLSGPDVRLLLLSVNDGVFFEANSNDGWINARKWEESSGRLIFECIRWVNSGVNMKLLNSFYLLYPLVVQILPRCV